MRPRNFTDEKKKEFVHQVETLKAQGKTTKEACKQAGIFSAQFYDWRGLFREPRPSREIVHKSNGNGAELKQLRIENQRLKLLLAEKCLDVQSLSEYCGKVA